MLAEDQMLVLRDNAMGELMKIKTVEEGISHLNKLSAIDKWVKAEKKDAELQNIVAEQKIRTQRILGQLLREGQSTGEIKTQATAKSTTAREVDSLGLSHKQSSTFQQIASIPDETFEEFIEEKKQAVNNAVAELTTTGAVRLAKSLRGKDAVDSLSEVDEEIRINNELKSVAHEINMNYTKEQRKTIVSLIKI